MSSIKSSLSKYLLPCFYLLHTINMRIRVAQADEALPFHRIPHDAPTSAICYIAVCSAQYTLWFFCSEGLTQAPAKRLTLKSIAQLFENGCQKSIIVIFPQCIILQPMCDCLPRQIFGFILRGFANWRALCWFVKVKVEWASIKLSTTHPADITPLQVRRTLSGCQQCWSWIVD